MRADVVVVVVGREEVLGYGLVVGDCPVWLVVRSGNEDGLGRSVGGTRCYSWNRRHSLG